METKTNINGGVFLITNTEPDQVFTPEDFSEEQLMMKEAVMEFIDREVWPNKARFEKKDYAFTESLMKKAGDLGFLSVPVPENYGGMGMGFVSTMLVCDYISGATGSLSTAFGAHTGIGILPIDVGAAYPELENPYPDFEPIEIESWLVAHRELKTNLRIRLVFDLLAECLSTK